MVEWIMEPLGYGFFLRGLIAGIAVALACGALSSFVVWRGMAFIGDALAHAVLPGIVVAFIAGIPLLLGALGAALFSVVGIGALTRRKGFKEDTAIGVIFAGAFALGILLMSKVASFTDLSHILFGNILGVGGQDLLIIGIIAAVVVLSLIVFFKELLVTSFDPTHAIAIGLSPSLIQYGLLILVAATTVIATQTVGVVLVLALLVTPAATASLLGKNLKKIMVASMGISTAGVVVGFYVSYYWDLASGASIVLVLTLFFLAALMVTRFRRGKA